MWVKNSNPNKGDWYIIMVEGKKFPAMYNEFNKFWCGQDGKTYKPEKIDMWLDDSKVEIEPEWDNQERKRYYGLRKGDIVEYNIGHTMPRLKGEVVEYGVMDNNAVYLKVEEKEKPISVVAEWCDIITKVEDK